VVAHGVQSFPAADDTDVRLTALEARLGLAAARLIAVDLRRFAPDQRILTLVLAGVALLVVSFAYARRERERSVP
jgi:hypothetical protein